MFSLAPGDAPASLVEVSATFLHLFVSGPKFMGEPILFMGEPILFMGEPILFMGEPILPPTLPLLPVESVLTLVSDLKLPELLRVAPAASPHLYISDPSAGLISRDAPCIPLLGLEVLGTGPPPVALLLLYLCEPIHHLAPNAGDAPASPRPGDMPAPGRPGSAGGPELSPVPVLV